MMYAIHARMNRVEQMKTIQKEALELFTKKNIDYGDAFAKYGVIGVLTSRTMRL
jgi:hypothetical protein